MFSFTIFFSYREVKPNHFLLILHETPGSRFSLIPGDNIGRGSAFEKLKLGEYKHLAIDKQKKVRNVQYHNDNCKNYEPNDSQAKCIIENLLVPRFTNLSHHINTCQRQDMNVTRLCMAPQLYNVLDIMNNNYSLPQCQTEDEYVCTTVGKFFLVFSS